MREAFIKTILQAAKEDRNVELLTADLGFGILNSFWEECPDQFLNVGIAEQNMTSIAAGMALEGKTVFTYSIGNFPTLRCLEQIRNDCAIHNANVKIVCVGGGYAYGALGASHHATEDLAVMRSLPNISVFAPADAPEAVAVAKAVLNHPGTCYIRLGRGGEPNVRASLPDFRIGKAIPIRTGSRVALFSTGDICEEVISSADALRIYGIEPTLYTFPTVKPIDRETIQTCSASHELIVTVEEHNLSGGFGSAVAEVMAACPGKARLLSVGIPDTYCSVTGDRQYLRRISGIDRDSILHRILEALP